MNTQTTTTPTGPDALALMQAAVANSELGKNLHILIRSAIPGSVSVRGIDETAWEALKSDLRGRHAWCDGHHITIREFDHAGKPVCFDALHLDCGITLFAMPHRRTVTLCYDHRSDRRALADLTAQLESVRTREPASRLRSRPTSPRPRSSAC